MSQSAKSAGTAESRDAIKAHKGNKKDNFIGRDFEKYECFRQFVKDFSMYFRSREACYYLGGGCEGVLILLRGSRGTMLCSYRYFFKRRKPV